MSTASSPTRKSTTAITVARPKRPAAHSAGSTRCGGTRAFRALPSVAAFESAIPDHSPTKARAVRASPRILLRPGGAHGAHHLADDLHGLALLEVTVGPEG